MSIGYKVVCVTVRNKLCSYNQEIPWADDYLEYKVGEVISAPNNTRIFIFDTLHNAKQCFRLWNVTRKLFRCEYFGGVAYNGAIDERQYTKYWEWFNNTLAKKKGFKNTVCPYDIHDYRGVLLVKQVKLIEEVPVNELIAAGYR